MALLTILLGGTNLNVGLNVGPNILGLKNIIIIQYVNENQKIPLSSLPLDQQQKFNGATWLDQELVSDTPAPIYNAGFGKEVKVALAQRRQWLMTQGFGAKSEFGLWKLAPNMLDTLRRRELLLVSGQLSGELGLNFLESCNGDRIDGIVKRHVDLAQGRFALIEKSREFTLVPWRDVLEKLIGKQCGGIMRESGVSWTIGRSRGGPTIS